MKSFEIEQRIREEGKEEGLAEGMEKGVTQGRIRDILELLSDLGEVPPFLKERINSQKDEAVLSRWLKLAAKAESLETFLSSMQ